MSLVWVLSVWHVVELSRLYCRCLTRLLVPLGIQSPSENAAINNTSHDILLEDFLWLMFIQILLLGVSSLAMMSPSFQIRRWPRGHHGACIFLTDS